jgi:hypothetical protein
MKQYFVQQISTIVREVIEPALTAGQRAIWNRATIDYPVDPNGELLNFYAGGLTVTLPIVSLMFLHDLVVASLWQDVNNCKATVLQYVSMLKYKNASLMSSDHLDPIGALRIPAVGTQKLAMRKPEFGRRFGTVMYSVLLFVTAHEVGHIVLSHRGSPSADKEIEADEFAFGVMAKQQMDPTGVLEFFLLSSLWVPTEAELKAAGKSAVHPMNGTRVRTLGSRLLEHPEYYYPEAKPSDPRVPLLERIALALINIGNDLDRVGRGAEILREAFGTNASELGSCP